MSLELRVTFPDKDHVSVHFGSEESGVLAFTNPLTAKDRKDIQWYFESMAAIGATNRMILRLAASRPNCLSGARRSLTPCSATVPLPVFSTPFKTKEKGRVYSPSELRTQQSFPYHGSSSTIQRKAGVPVPRNSSY